MLIEKSLELFLETAIPKLMNINGKVHTDHCPHCGRTIRIPIIAKELHVWAFLELMRIAEKYLDEKGLNEKILAELLTRINDRLNIQ